MAGTSDASPVPIRFLTRALDEVGLVALFHSPLDTKLLCLQRFVRLFAYGSSTLILVAYLSALGSSDSRIGLFMTLTLAGDVLISFCLAMIADSLGRRKILALGALLMAGSGLVFGLFGNYWILLAAAIFGVITPSGNEIGPFRAIEESTIAHLTPPEHRSDIFAWYALIGTAGSALGLLSCGLVTSHLISSQNWDPIRAYRVMFFGYGIIGLVKFVLAMSLSKKCEADEQPPSTNATETAPLLGNGTKPTEKKSKFAVLPNFSAESKAILIELCILFAFDNFASGLAPLSWVTNYFKRRFNLPEHTIGTLFFVTSIISACSILVASSIAKRIGNVKTMVLTHLPSSICLALIGIPSSLPLAMTLVILRSCTQSMDTAPRSAFLSAVVLPHERTATMGVINLVKTFAQSLGPLITGLLAERNLFWVAFLVAGLLKATYDLGMLAIFLGHKTREERAVESEQAAETRTNGNEVETEGDEEADPR